MAIKQQNQSLTLSNLRKKTIPILSHIDRKWDDLTTNARQGHHDTIESWKRPAGQSTDGHLGDVNREHPHILYLPNDYVFPGGRFGVQFYWDSYFIILSLLTGPRFDLARGMVDNFLYLVRTYGMVIANRKRWAAGSQLPFLSAMVRAIHEHGHDKTWLQGAVQVLEIEYRNYWLNPDHLCYRGQSRYHAPSYFPAAHIAAITIDNESTWDLTPRFDEEDILSLLPIDLNSNLYMYEQNFAYFYKQLGQVDLGASWRHKAQKRLEVINELMWDPADGLYYDYNFKIGQRKKIKSAACFFPLFHRMADAVQAEKVKNNLPLFEKTFGLATCDVDYGYADRQWNFPVGWAPVHWVVYNGLKNYGYIQEAERIALKWLNLNYKVWRQTKQLYEKYDVVRGTHEIDPDRRYTNQPGFGWTNAVFHLLVTDLLGHTRKPAA